MTGTLHDEEARIRLPWSRSCFVCGEANPQGLRARIFKVGDLIEMPFVPRREFVGWSDVIHGGLISTVLDEVMTWASIVAVRKGFFAAELSVRLKAPLPPETECIARAWIASSRRRIVAAESVLESATGNVYATASGRYLPIPPEQLSALRRDLVWNEECLDPRSLFQL
jgi:acyl-coenzyme A thioesterase PaaI-like protein